MKTQSQASRPAMKQEKRNMLHMEHIGGWQLQLFQYWLLLTLAFAPYVLPWVVLVEDWSCCYQRGHLDGAGAQRKSEAARLNLIRDLPWRETELLNLKGTDIMQGMCYLTRPWMVRTIQTGFNRWRLRKLTWWGWHVWSYYLT